MKERPIPFSGPMVRALLAGTKTQTRRVCKPQPSQVLGSGRRVYRDEDFKKSWAHLPGMHESLDPYVDVPYGAPGDRLWVRETWAIKTGTDRGHHSRVIYAADMGEKLIHWQDGHDIGARYGYDLTGRERNRPSIRMPRWASRITLEITEVRVQRLQEISEADAKAEGIDIGAYADKAYEGIAVAMYHELWESINGAGSWDANPWVWAISFRRIV